MDSNPEIYLSYSYAYKTSKADNNALTILL